LSYYSQPITLVVTPGVTATGAPPTTVLEVATDSAFASIVFTKTLPTTVNGQARVPLDHLNAATTYYWLVKTTAGGNPSVVSAVSTFTIGPQLVIQAPTPVTPLADTFPHRRPTFIVTNAAHTGPPATLIYRFDVGTDPTFSAVVATGTVSEGAGQTSLMTTADLRSGTTYYWRAQASDTTKGVIGDYSRAQVFTTVYPEDGAYRYTLLVRSPTWCLTHYSSGGPCRPGEGHYGWLVSDFSFDSSLTIEGDTLEYRLPPAVSFASGPFTWNMRREGDQLKGSVSGSTPSAPFASNTVTFYHGAISGQADNAGRFDGTARWGLVALVLRLPVRPHYDVRHLRFHLDADPTLAE
jgi:hypothetical protein